MVRLYIFWRGQGAPQLDYFSMYLSGVKIQCIFHFVILVSHDAMNPPGILLGQLFSLHKVPLPIPRPLMHTITYSLHFTTTSQRPTQRKCT